MTDSPPTLSPERDSQSRVAFLAVGVVIALGVLSTILVIVILPRLRTPMAQVQANRALYDQAIQDIESGTISGGSINGDLATLPTTYALLSSAKNGEVIIYRAGPALRVLFYPGQQGMRTWVYMYTSDDKPNDLEGECSGIQHERPNWFLFHCP